MLAISADHVYSHNVFDASLGTLPYPLIADWHKRAIRDYGVLNEEDGTAKRSCFVVNKEGSITFVKGSFNARLPEDYEAVFQACEQCRSR